MKRQIYEASDEGNNKLETFNLSLFVIFPNRYKYTRMPQLKENPIRKVPKMLQLKFDS